MEAAAILQVRLMDSLRDYILDVKCLKRATTFSNVDIEETKQDSGMTLWFSWEYRFD